MADVSMESFSNDWWPSELKLRELEYENSKLLVQQDDLTFQKWKTDIDLLINDEKLHRESKLLTELSQTSTEQHQLLQDEVKSLKKELKECKELLCQTRESLEDVKENSRVEKKRLEERLTSEAKERHAKEQQTFEKERDTLNEEIERWKNLKEKLETEMEKTFRLEADEKVKQQEKIKQQENKTKSEIENLYKQLQTWKNNHEKAAQEVENLKAECENKTVISKSKATQTQTKMVSKAVMAGVECVDMGIQVDREHHNRANKKAAVIESDNEDEKENGRAKESKKPSKKQSRPTRKSVHNSKESEPAEESLSERTDHTSGSESDQQPDQQSKESTNNKILSDAAPLKDKQKRTARKTRKNVKSKEKQSSDEDDAVSKARSIDEVHTGVHGNVPTGAHDEVPTGAHEEVPTGAHEEVPTGAHEEVPTGAREEVPTRAHEEVPTGTREEVPTGAHEELPTGARKDILTETQEDLSSGEHDDLPAAEREAVHSEIRDLKSLTGEEVSDKETSDKIVRRLRKRKCNKKHSTIEEMAAKKAKSSTNNTVSSAKDESNNKEKSCSSPDFDLRTGNHDNEACCDGDEKSSDKNVKDISGEANNENVVLSGENQDKRRLLVNKRSSVNTDHKDKGKRRKTKQHNHDNILKEKNGQVKSASQPKGPALTRPSASESTRQSSIVEISSILNGTKRQKTLYNTKDNSLMVSFLPVQESFMNSTTSRGHKPNNGSMPPSLSAFMRSFIAPKLKKKSQS